MQWRVTGADRATGEDRTITVEANDVKEAGLRANEANLLVEKFDLIGETIPYATPQAKRIRRYAILPMLVTIALLAVISAVVWTRTSSPPAKPPTAKPPIATTIQGGAWVSKKSGNSDLLRGLHILVLQPNVRRADVVKRMAPDVFERKRLADAFDRGDFSRKEHADEIKFHRALAAEADAFAADPATEADALKAFRLASRVATDSHGVLAFDRGIPRPIGNFSAKAVASATTDVQGTYRIDGLAPGNYYLYADFTTELSSIEWMIPVSATGGPIKIDLYNDTASRIVNSAK